jgi:hypothetical protein
VSLSNGTPYAQLEFAERKLSEAEAENERLRERIERMKFADRTPALVAEIERLHKIIAAAPHGHNCQYDGRFEIGEDRECDCWKAQLRGDES